MNGTFRQSMGWLHTWAGLIVSSLLYFMFVTGSAGYFDTEIDRWMQPETVLAEGAETASMVLLAEQYVARQVTDVESWRVSLPVGREPLLKVSWQDAQGERGETILNPHTGFPVVVRKTGGGQLLYAMHWRLHYFPYPVNRLLTSTAAMFMLIALITGIVVHKKIFKDFFTFRHSKQQRSWLDMHNLLSVLPLPFHLMITYSGLLYLASVTMMPAIITSSYGADWQIYFDQRNNRAAIVEPAGKAVTQLPLAILISDVEQRWGKHSVKRVSVANSGDMNGRVNFVQSHPNGLDAGATLTYDSVSGEILDDTSTQDLSLPTEIRNVVLALHEGLFAGWPLRWLYFLSGILGAGMIATGMILWVVKRRAKSERLGTPDKGLALVENLNAGTIIGLPIAIAVYFWANRLLAVNVTDRAGKEVAALFITWAITLMYPIFRPARRAWIELLWAAAAVYSLLPIVNAFTTEHHLANSLAQGDWVMAGFDLTVLAFGAAFVLAAYYIQEKKPYGQVKTLEKSEIEELVVAPNKVIAE
ncbi:MAG: putative iron-regulated membrane protein [Paraglaciecola sp.]|jgi:uncharacterized iron-regulated membrane protein